MAIDIQYYIDLSREKTKQILLLEKKFGEVITKSQAQLWQSLSAEWLSKLEVDEAGKIIYSAKNIQVLNGLDEEWNRFNKLFQENIIKSYANDLLKVSALSGDYFSSMGFASSEKVIQNMAKVKKLLEVQLGIRFAKNQFKSTIIKGSYLDKLAQGEEIKKRIKNLAMAQVASGGSYKEFSMKLKEMIIGSPEINGAMVKYYKTYAYDTFSAVQASTDLYMANNLGLSYFIYAGTEIKTSRPFCIDRIGRVYSREQAEKWENMSWAGKNEDSSFFIARGGYNCRHMLDWISDELAEELKAEQTDDTQVVNVNPFILKEKPKKVIPIIPKTKKPKAPKKVKPSQEFIDAEKGWNLSGSDDYETSAIMAKEFRYTQREYESMTYYTGSGYSGMNRFLRRLEETSDYDKESIIQLESAIKKAPKYTGSDMLYRGVGFSSKTEGYLELVSQLKEGNVLIDKGFMSTSHRNLKWESGRRYRFNFQIVENNGRGAPVERISSLQNEHEVLFNKGTAFKVLRIDKKTYEDLDEQWNILIKLLP